MRILESCGCAGCDADVGMWLELRVRVEGGDDFQRREQENKSESCVASK